MAALGSNGLPDLQPGSSLETAFTGERVVPGSVDPDLFNEHFSRYAFARRFAGNRRVLDLGCGTGYGAAALAEVATLVTAIDLSAAAIAYAQEHYARPNLTFEQGDAVLPRGPYDLVVAFEVIEHLSDWPALLHAGREAIDQGGIFLVSTPNKPVYAEMRGTAGENPFHTHEFEADEFRAALAQVFPHVQILVQNHSAGLMFAPPHRAASACTTGAVEFADAEIRIGEAHFFLAICSLHPVPIEPFVWLASTSNLLRDRQRHIALLSSEVELKTQWHHALRAELESRNREFATLLEAHQSLQSELEQRTQWAMEQDSLLRTRGQRIEQLQAEADQSHREFEAAVAAYETNTASLEQQNREITGWAQETERRLNAETESLRATLARAVELLHEAEATVEQRTEWAQALERELHEWQARFVALRDSRWVRTGTRLRLLAADRT